MDSTENLLRGHLVASKAGRDQGRLFVVMGIINDQYVLVADGDLRKIEKPKKKNIRHLVKRSDVLEEIARKIENQEKMENMDLRRAIEPYEVVGLAQEN